MSCQFFEHFSINFSFFPYFFTALAKTDRKTGQTAWLDSFGFSNFGISIKTKVVEPGRLTGQTIWLVGLTSF
jgi:hypothetical protein